MRVELSGHQFTFPQACACCGYPAQSTLVASARNVIGHGRTRYSVMRAWNIPYCFNCARHVRLFYLAHWSSLVVLAASGLSALRLYGDTQSLTVAFQVLIVGLCGAVCLYFFVMRRARYNRVAGCVSVREAARYIGWYGSHHSFEIKSRGFAHSFMSLNERKLINLSPHTVHWLKKSGLDQETAIQTSHRSMTRTRH